MPHFESKTQEQNYVDSSWTQQTNANLKSWSEQTNASLKSCYKIVNDQHQIVESVQVYVEKLQDQMDFDRFVYAIIFSILIIVILLIVWWPLVFQRFPYEITSIITSVS
jgi:hypothetical protein